MFVTKTRGTAKASPRAAASAHRVRVIAGAATILAAFAVTTAAPAEANEGHRRIAAKIAAASKPAPGARSFSGQASYYGSESGSRTASGARYNPNGLTAAHRTLPFGTQVLVTEPRSGRSVVVTINDRGPFIRGRVLDLSVGAARAIGITGRGVGRVVAEVL